MLREKPVAVDHVLICGRAAAERHLAGRGTGNKRP
jgi:hypothetical protein